MRTFKLFFVSIFLLAPPAVRAADAPPISLPDVLEKARSANPDILAARQTWAVRRDEVGPAGAWPNPMFTFQDERLPIFEGGSAETLRRYRVEQTIPFPGKLSTDAQMKRHESLIGEANYRSKEIEVLGDVRIRYYQLYLADQKIALARDSVETLRSVLKTAQSRLASGQSSTSDVFMAQIELRKTENMEFEAQQARTLAEIELNTLLNQSTETPWGVTTIPNVIDLPATLHDFQDVARQTAPLFQAAAHEQNHARAMVHRGRLEFAPDFSLSYEREVPSVGEAGRQIGIGLSVPVWLSRPIGVRNAAREHMLEAESLSQSMENMVMRMVHTEFTETVTHLTLARNYEHDILPTAQSNFRVAREQYAGGRGDFMRILEAFRAWIEANNQYQDQLYHYGEHWSLLERWVGTDLTKVKEASHAK